MNKLKGVKNFLKPTRWDILNTTAFELTYNGLGFAPKPLETIISIPIIYLCSRAVKKGIEYYGIRKEMELKEGPILV